MTKTKQQIRDEAAEKYYDVTSDVFYKDDYLAGWDSRDRLDNEALKIALETLEEIAGPLPPHPDVCSLARSMEDAAQATLAEIKKIVGEGRCGNE